MNNQYENTWLFIGYCHYSTRDFRNEKGTGAETTCTAIDSGIVTGDAPVSYWSIFSRSLTTVPEVCAKVNSAQFPSRMADCITQERMPCDTSPSPPICYRYCIPFIPGIIREPLLVGYFPLKPAGINGVFNKLESWSEKRYQPLGYLISLNLSSRCLFQLVLRKQNNKFIKKKYKRKEKKSYLSSAWALPVSPSFHQNLLNPPTC